MADKLRSLCKTTKVVTNGVFLTEERLRDLMAARVRSITISLDTTSRDVYVAFKGHDQFDRVMKNTHDAVRMVLNMPHIELVIKGIEAKEEKLNAKQLIEHFLQRYPEIERSDNVHIEIRKEFEWPSSDNLPLYHDMCELPFYQLAIHWDGKVSACCNDIEYGVVVGDVTKTSLQEIIRGETLSEIRKDMIDKNFDSLDTCLRCSFRTVVTDFGEKKDQIRGLL
jgi:radical SAM protein with 4Fe4S-binding SPASM domain